MKKTLEYYRKITCTSLNIDVILEDQANALRLFTLMKNKGYHDAQLFDFFIDGTKKVKLSDDKIEKLLAKVK